MAFLRISAYVPYIYNLPFLPFRLHADFWTQLVLTLSTGCFHLTSWQGKREEEGSEALTTPCRRIQRISCVLVPCLSCCVSVSEEEEGSCYSETCFPPSFLALLRRPLWRGLMALWDKPPSDNNCRSKVKLNSEE